MKEKYYEFVKLNDEITELYIYGDIRKPGLIEKWLGVDDETRVDAFSFKDALNEVDTPKLVVRINSMGGDVSEGLAIYGLLSDFKGELITKVDGFACSAASIIFMAGEKRIVPTNGLIMIHNAWSCAEGNANDFRKFADDLDMITKPSLNIYCEKTGLDENEIKSMMDEETWMDYKIAIEKGFATNVENANNIQQSISDINKYLQKTIRENIKLKEEKNHLENKIKLFSSNEKEDIKNNWESFFNTEK